MKKFLLVTIAVFAIVLLSGCGNEKRTLSCSTEQSTNGVTSSSKIDVDFNGNEAEKITLEISITYSEEYADYLDTLKSTIETQKTTLENTGYTVDVTYGDNTINLSAVGTNETLTDEEKSGSYEVTKKNYENQGLKCK